MIGFVLAAAFFGAVVMAVVLAALPVLYFNLILLAKWAVQTARRCVGFRQSRIILAKEIPHGQKPRQGRR
jgi:hypothetical protein